MPCFVCEKCGCIENSALSMYWSKDWAEYEDSSLNGMALCSECTPKKYASGEDTGYGEWHGKFEKEYFDPKVDPGNGLMNVHDGKVIPNKKKGGKNATGKK